MLEGKDETEQFIDLLTSLTESGELEWKRHAIVFIAEYKNTEIMVGGFNSTHLTVGKKYIGYDEEICNLKDFEKLIDSICKEREGRKDEKERQKGLCQIKELMKGEKL